MSSNQKNKNTLFPSTLKVVKNKVALFFHLELIWARYGYVLDFGVFYPFRALYKLKNNAWLLHYLMSLTTGRRSNFHLSSNERVMAIFLISKTSICKLKKENYENCYILLTLAQSGKKPTLFCPTFKVEENRVVLSFWFELKLANYGNYLYFKNFYL